MVIVIENLFTQERLDQIVEQLPSLSEYDGWFDNGQVDFVEELNFVASRYFDLSQAVGTEMHKNIISLGGHYDKDELLFKTTGELKFPLCGIVFYPKIEYMVGGELIFENMIVKPQTNMFVAFNGNMFHSVAPHSGTRVSIGVNPWDEKPLAYRQKG